MQRGIVIDCDHNGALGIETSTSVCRQCREDFQMFNQQVLFLTLSISEKTLEPRNVAEQDLDARYRKNFPVDYDDFDWQTDSSSFHSILTSDDPDPMSQLIQKIVQDVSNEDEMFSLSNKFADRNGWFPQENSVLKLSKHQQQQQQQLEDEEEEKEVESDQEEQTVEKNEKNIKDDVLLKKLGERQGQVLQEKLLKKGFVKSQKLGQIRKRFQFGILKKNEMTKK